MKKLLFRAFVPLALLIGQSCLAPAQAAPATEPDLIALARAIVKADRQAVVSDALQLTDIEASAFWPVYHQYRTEMDAIGNDLVKLVRDYAGCYPEVPEQRAQEMLRSFLSLEKRKTAIRASFLKKTGKTIPAAKNLRFAQIENRLDLALQLKLAAGIPLTPVEGQLTAESTSTTALIRGVPGGAVVQTTELKATVISIDKANRKLTLLGADGIKQTIKAGPEAVNFDQVRVGDRLTITIAEALVVSVAGAGEEVSDAAAQLVALAPKGAKPGGILAETTQLTAQIAAIDTNNHCVTLRFEDGTTKTVAVRPDVDLYKRKVGEKVVIRATEAMALKVGAP